MSGYNALLQNLMPIMTIQDYMRTLGQQARQASRRLAAASTAEKNAALQHLADAIRRERATLLAANGLYARLWAHQSGGFLGEEADDDA